LRPLLKDANDMLMDNWNIREWVEDGLKEKCVVCKASIDDPEYEFEYDARGVLYYRQHCQQA